MATITDYGYLVQCDELLQKLKNDIKHIESGEATYFKDIALRLRVLLCDKSGTPALLKSVEKSYQFDIQVLIKYTIEEKAKMGFFKEELSKKLETGVLLYTTNSAVTWFKEGDDKVSIFDAIEHNEIMINKNHYSYKNIIEVIADKMVAHIDRTIPDKDLKLHDGSLLIGGLPIAQREIIEVGKAMIILLESVIDFIERDKPFEWIQPKSST
ncbi:MAG: hypothetical protein HON27_13240 [Candidatus Marinimicrobia bacterium]|jgi:hypothetical protein|nr:hypothetical protein [Candidatus Neomarinimicrobiota bacterium]